MSKYNKLVGMGGDQANPLFSLKNKVYDVISSHKSSLLGRILTIVDASARDEEQRKAIKDLVREAVWANPSLPESYDINEMFGQFSYKYEGKPIEKLPSFDMDKVAINWFPNSEGEAMPKEKVDRG